MKGLDFLTKEKVKSQPGELNHELIAQIAELKKDNEAFARNYSELQVLYGETEAENTRLREALDEIVNPIKYMQQTAQKEGLNLNGEMAITLSKEPSYLKRIAEKALNS